MKSVAEDWEVSLSGSHLLRALARGQWKGGGKKLSLPLVAELLPWTGLNELQALQRKSRNLH